MKKFMVFLTFFFTFWTYASPSSQPPFRIAMENTLKSIHPYRALSFYEQRFNKLLYRSLLKLDQDLNPKPDLARAYQVDFKKNEVRFSFDQKKDLENSLLCFQNYKKSASLLVPWKAVRLEKQELIFSLMGSTESFLKSLELYPYFESKKNPPCEESTKDEDLVTTGEFKFLEFENERTKPVSLYETLTLEKKDLTVQFVVIRDETSQVLQLRKHKIDSLYNAIGLAKTNWVEKNLPDFKIIQKDGNTLSYLMMNTKDPILRDEKVRQAIRYAINRKDVSDHKNFGYTRTASSFFPHHQKSTGDSHSLEKAEMLLESAGYKKNKNGIRFSLSWMSTSNIFGLEYAQIFREQLKKVGIEILIHVVDFPVMLKKQREANYQLSLGRWFQIVDESILITAHTSNHKDNKAHIDDPKMNEILSKISKEKNLKKRSELVNELEKTALEKNAYIPLFYWNHALILSRKWELDSNDSLSERGDYSFLQHLKWKGN